MIKYTFPVLIALHFLWKPIAPSIAFQFIALACFVSPAKNLLPRQVTLNISPESGLPNRLTAQTPLPPLPPSSPPLLRPQRPSADLVGAPRSVPLRAKVDHELMSFPSGDSACSALVMGSLYVWAEGR